MSIQTEGKELLKRHKKLFEELIQIPERRDFIYHEELDNNILIGKPRFKEKEFDWSQDLLIQLRDHLQGLWNYFQLYSYWLDSSLLLLLDYRTRKASKKSIIFLLEMDVWQTDEVYGDYIIKRGKNTTKIYYTRFGNKYNEFKLHSVDDGEIKDYICKDAMKQIQRQFTHLWEKLEQEIVVLMREKFRKKPKISLKIDYLKEQVDKIEKIVDSWSESALLNLGRVLEIWLLVEMNVKKNFGLDFLIREAEIRNLIDKHQFQLLMNIKNNYNSLKHEDSYKVDNLLVQRLFKDFFSTFIHDRS